MLIYKEEIKLDPFFPFQLEEYHLRKENNAPDVYHYHDFCEITYIESGVGKYLVNDTCYEVRTGDIIIFNNIEPHAWQGEAGGMSVLVMTFAAELVSDPGNVFSGEYLKSFVARGSNFQNRIASTDQTATLIYRIMTEIKQELKDCEMGYRDMIKADILLILTYLTRHYQIQDDAQMEQRRQFKRITPALFYINEHYTEEMKLEEVAKTVYMSPNYFSSYFKKTIGRSFVDYVNLLRLKKVQELYRMTTKSMADLALECGFSNISNFYRMYKKHVGELPDKKQRGNSAVQSAD